MDAQSFKELCQQSHLDEQKRMERVKEQVGSWIKENGIDFLDELYDPKFKEAAHNFSMGILISGSSTYKELPDTFSQDCPDFQSSKREDVSYVMNVLMSYAAQYYSNGGFDVSYDIKEVGLGTDITLSVHLPRPQAPNQGDQNFFETDEDE